MDTIEKSLVEQNAEVLKYLADQKIWWMTPGEAIQSPYRVLAQIMNLGSADEWHLMLKTFGTEPLKHVIAHAQAGWFYRKQWCFWHTVLGLSDPLKVPPLPQRPIPSFAKSIHVSYLSDPFSHSPS